MSLADVTEVWATRINNYRASGERVAAWCSRNQVTSHQLYYWMRKLREAERQERSAGNESKWVALALQESTTGEAPPIVIKIGTIAVEVQAGFDPAAFATVVRTLKTLC